MIFRFFTPLLLLAALFAAPAQSAPVPAGSQPLPDTATLIAACEQKLGQPRFHLHICLIAEFNKLEARTDFLTDKLLGLVGAHRSFGRLKIIQWSDAIVKSQRYWQKTVPWDCEWEGHVLATPKGAAVAMDRCGIKRAGQRVKLLEKRVKTLETIVNNAKNGK